MLYPFEGELFTSARLPMTYNGLTINDDNKDPATEAIYEVNICSVNDQWDAVTEVRQMTHGMEGYEPRKVSTLIRLDGVIRAPSIAVLIDAVGDLNAAFDPVNVYTVDPTTYLAATLELTGNRGYLPFTFSIPTADTTNYSTGFITAKYYVRSISRPVQSTSQYEGTTCRFTLFLQAIDPRAYFTTLQVAARTGTAGVISVNNTLATFPSWGYLAFAITGAGSQIVSVTRTGMTGLIKVDLTGVAENSIVAIDFAHKKVTTDGVLSMSKLTQWDSWPEIRAGVTDTWTVANVTGTLAGDSGIYWERAFS